MKDNKSLYGKFDIFGLIDTSEERKTDGLNISAPLETKMVDVKEIKKSAKELVPFGTEELEGYGFSEDDYSKIRIVCGWISEITLQDGQVTIDIEARDGVDSIKIHARRDNVLDKAKTMQKGDPITAVVNDENECVGLKFGPVFGQTCIKLRKKTNKKIGLNCIVSI